MAGYRYQAFLCYSHRDSAWADWLHHALESFPIPTRLVGIETGAGVIPRKLAPVFRDRDELPSATNLGAKVSDALAQSANLVVICSPHAAQSHWVDEEVRAFQRLGRGDRIFCLIVDGEPGASRWAGREHDECIPSALTHRLDAAGNETGERLDPVAADVRPGMDGKADARTKLVAGLLGVDLDDLRQRERRRRRWNATAAIALGFALVCLTSALAVNAVIARHAAERRQKQAEDLIGFMLGDLDDKLRQVNRLDILESVADKAVRYFGELPLADMSADTMAQRSRALLKIGAVRRDQGRVAEAVDAFRLAQESSDRLVAGEPDNADYLAINAESQTWLGFVDFSQGRLDDALKRFRSALAALERANATRPDDVKLIEQIAINRSNAGKVHEARESLADARREYMAVIGLYERLSRIEPTQLDWKAELGYAHANLAQLAIEEGNLEEAIVERAADQRVKAGLLTVDPTNNIRREDLAAANAKLAEILVMCGEVERARVHMRAALDEAESLVAVDPTSTDWLEKAGDYSWRMAEIERATGNAPGAAQLAETGVMRLRALSAKDAQSVVWSRRLAQAHIEAARTYLAAERMQPAQQAAAGARRIVDASSASHDPDKATALLGAQLRLLEGDLAAASRAADAGIAWRRVAEILPVNEGVREPAVLDVQVSAQLRQGQSDTVKDALAQLWKVGYARPDFVAGVHAAGLPFDRNTEVLARVERALDGDTSISRR